MMRSHFRLSIAARSLALLTVVALGAGSALAQQTAPTAAADPWNGTPLRIPVPAAAKLVAITNATILTASHGTIQNGTIIIRDGKIAAIGANIAVPAGAQIIDGTGKTLIPGLVMVHEHLFYPTGPGVYGNLAESFYMGIPALSWMTVVIGDPLMRLVPP